MSGEPIVILGAGSTGEALVSAVRAYEPDTPITIVERELAGGECSYYACMPTKGMLRPPEAVAAARNVPGAAEAVTGLVDAERLFWHRDQITNGWDDSSQADWLESNGADAGARPGEDRPPGRCRGRRPGAALRPAGGCHRVVGVDPADPRPGRRRVLDQPGGDANARGAREHRHRRRRAGGLRVRPAVLPTRVAGRGRGRRRPAAPQRGRGGGADARRGPRGRGRCAAPGRRDRRRRAGDHDCTRARRAGSRRSGC